MSRADWFANWTDEFDESIRIDDDDADHRRKSIESYHVTADSGRVIREFVDRTLGEAEDMRSGSNYWLYGYYGSGKSHLLTVLEGLLDTDWVRENLDAHWETLTDNAADPNIDDVRPKLERLHEEHRVVPISINLLKYQGRSERSFSQILLEHAFQSPTLTGIDDDISAGFSGNLDVAFFELWYRTTDSWADREADATEIVEERFDRDPAEMFDTTVWAAIQDYPALAEVVLPRLFERETGSRDGYTDLTPSDIDPETVVERLDQLRRRRETETGDNVKLVLLLDEVSLFIGDDDSKLTELQTIAEAVDEIDDANVQLVATAQETIEDSQPEISDQGNTGILKDRFPHRYQLPSKHVGEIARLRLLEKTTAGKDGVKEVLSSASIDPSNSLVYSDIGRNTQPPLDDIRQDDLEAFYPFAPYQAPLFLDILSNLRQEAADPAKSIFSGTARAILALMHRLLQEWSEDDAHKRHEMISVIEFFDEIKPALRETLRSDMRVLEGVDGTRDTDSDAVETIVDEVAEGGLTEFDLRVAKAVMLLQTVSDMVPMTERNIAVSVMRDLEGDSLISTQNRVEESLDRLEKFVRPNESESGPRYRFATYQERQIYETTAAKEADPDWESIVDSVDRHLITELIDRLSLPETVPFDESGDQYPVNYTFRIDGTPLETRRETAGSLEVPIAFEGLRPDVEPGRYSDDPIEWTIDTEGLADLRESLVEWWALRDATADRSSPEAVQTDLDERKAAVLRKLEAALADGTYTVKDRPDIQSPFRVVQTAIEVNYHKVFHPMLLQITDDQLNSLASMQSGDPLPTWAETIEIPPEDTTIEPDGSIQRAVRLAVGKPLKESEESLTLATVLDELAEKIPFFSDAKPAACAIIWGYCRRGLFRPVDEAGTNLADEAVLDPTRRQQIRLQLLSYENPRDALEKAGYLESTETLNEGLQTLQRANETLISELESLRKDVELDKDNDITADPILRLLESFLEAIDSEKEAAEARLSAFESQQRALDEIITDTVAAERWLEEAEDTWTRRKSLLLRYDIHLTLAERSVAWIDETTAATLETHRDGIASYQGDWWTESGWSNLVENTEVQIGRDLKASWDAFVDSKGLADTVAAIRSHRLVQSPNEVSCSTFEVFRTQYLRPLHRVVRWYDDVEEILAALEADDESVIANASKTAADTPSWETVTEPGDPATLLESIPSPEALDDTSSVGVLPGDRGDIETALKSLVEEEDLTVEETETGVVIS